MVTNIPMMIGLFGLLIISFSRLWSTSHGAALIIGDTLRPGEALNSSSLLVSASGEYTLGFNSGYLTLRYNNVITVWVANLDSQISDPSTALLTLDKNKALLQITGDKNIVLYYRSFSLHSASVVTLMDSGNLVLIDSDGKVSNRVWKSSDESGRPSVALRPQMSLGYDGLINEKIWSWKESQNSPGPGSFSLYYDRHTRQLIIVRDTITWWASGELSNGSYEFINIPNESRVKYDFNVVSSNEGEYFSYTTDKMISGSDQSVWILDSGGYLYDAYYGISIARAGDCDGYNTNGGCQRWGPTRTRTDGCYVDNPLATSGNHVEVIKHGSFKPIRMHSNYSVWLDDDYGLYGSDHCKDSCWKYFCDCLGFDFLFDNQTGCRYWSVKHFYFHEDPASSTTGFILPGTRRQYNTKTDASRKWIWIGIAITIVLLALVLCSICYLIRRRKLAGENQRKIQDMLNMINYSRTTDANGRQNYGKWGHDLSVFKYESIVAATCNFSDENKLGEGGFGPVYKGKLVTGQEVAVKRLSKCSGQGISEFKNELILIYELQHTNLVQLFGFCIHGEERMLIYEYLPNKSLDYFLFDSTRCHQLDWKNRFRIIEGIAQGLLYLHNYSRMRIIHRDLKASNVLLDERMNPKISDFGMARMFTNDEQEANTMKIVGTRGYMSPEYVMGGNFSIKSDVYSFGVLMLEILSGRKNNSFYNDERALNLVGYAWALWKEGAGLGLMDPTVGDSCDKDQLLRCIHVGLLCVEENAASRPTMLEVISMLGNESLVLSVPTKPAFCTHRNVLTPVVVGGNGPEMVASVNGISNSDFVGR